MFTAPVLKFAISLLQVSLLVFAGLTQSIARADGFRNPFQSAAAIAQGNAFAAQADDASAVFYNPSGMTQLRGIQDVGGMELVNVDTHFRGLNGRTTENYLGGPFGFPPPRCRCFSPPGRRIGTFLGSVI